MQSTSRIAPVVGLTILAAFGLAARPAAAQVTYLPNNTTINYAISQDTYIGESTTNTHTSPTVNLVKGGSVDGDLQAYNFSLLNVNGGTIFNNLYAIGGSTVNLSGGTVGLYLFANNASTVNVSGGTVGRYLYATNVSTVDVSGGTFGQFQGVNFVDSTAGQFNFIGTGLSYAPDPTGLMPPGLTGTDYTLTGLLQNGQSVTGDVIEVTNGANLFTFNATAVPEASTASLLGLGALCLVGLGLKARKRCPSV